MTSKYFIDNNDLSNIINLNPNSSVNVNNIFTGLDLSSNALDSVTSYYFDTSSNLQNIQTNFLYQNIDIINYSYPKNYIDFTTSISNYQVPTNLIYGVKIILIGGSGSGGGGSGSNANIKGSSGGSGSSGYVVFTDILKSNLGSSFSISIGSGGVNSNNGGSSSSSFGASGNNGANGNSSTFTYGTTTITSQGGIAGLGGRGPLTNTTGTCAGGLAGIGGEVTG